MEQGRGRVCAFKVELADGVTHTHTHTHTYTPVSLACSRAVTQTHTHSQALFSVPPSPSLHTDIHTQSHTQKHPHSPLSLSPQGLVLKNMGWGRKGKDKAF